MTHSITAIRIQITGSRQEVAIARNIISMMPISGRLFLTVIIIAVIVFTASLKATSSPEISVIPVTAEEHVLLTSTELAHGQREEKRYRLFSCHSGIAPKMTRGLGTIKE